MIRRCLSQGLILFIAYLGSARAQHFQSFSFYGKNGAGPQGGLAVDSAGNFYGSTSIGGTTNKGVVYEINSTSQNTLYSFTGSNGDGVGPVGDLILDNAGNLYGVTQYGGNYGVSCGTNGCGTVFELSPPMSQSGAWTETVLYEFQGPFSDGTGPLAGLVLDTAGNLYGTTSAGGVYNAGTVFELAPPSQPGGTWTESILHSFAGGTADGVLPWGQLIFDRAGNLYGTTASGGLYRSGTVFELSPPVPPGEGWTAALLHSFYGSDGINPEAGVTWGPGGTLFGTTSELGPHTGGTLFQLSPSEQGKWIYYVVYSFSSGTGFPAARVTFNGPNILYGTTQGGFVFQISYSGGTVTEMMLYEPGPSVAGVVLYQGALYSTTTDGGAHGDGSVYRLSH